MKKILVLLVTIVTLFAQDVFAQNKPQVTEEQKAAAKAKREQLMLTRLELLKTRCRSLSPYIVVIVARFSVSLVPTRRRE